MRSLAASCEKPAKTLVKVKRLLVNTPPLNIISSQNLSQYCMHGQHDARLSQPREHQRFVCDRIIGGEKESLSHCTKAKGRATTAVATARSLLSVPGKVFANVLFARLHPLLTARHRPQQSDFTPGRSTIDAILALRLLSELHQEFYQPQNVAYIDITAAFDSVDRAALWKALRSSAPHSSSS